MFIKRVQSYLGSSFVNLFTRFGHNYMVYAQADAPYRSGARQSQELSRPQSERRNGSIRHGRRDQSDSRRVPSSRSTISFLPPPSTAAPTMPSVLARRWRAMEAHRGKNVADRDEL